MTKKKTDELLTGNFDGIQEYDNDLPRWWVHLFVLTVILSGVYVIWVHGVGNPSDDQRLTQQMAALQDYQRAYQQAHAPAVSEIELVKAALNDTKAVEAGKTIFATRCAACHAAQGEGLVGPNLTDPYWIHGGSVEAIHRTIEQGVTEKGMLAWKGVISPEEIRDVTAFVWSIRGNNLPGKPPQGEVIAGN